LISHFFLTSFKKAANQANSKLWCINYTICQMFMSSAWMCHVAVFCIFLYKAMWSTAHRYYSTGARHSVALKQFSPSSCIQELMKKETYIKTCYAKYINTGLMLHRGIKIWTVNISVILISGGGRHFTVILEHFCSCDGPLQWNPFWRGTFTTCLQRPSWNSLNKQFIPTKCMHVFSGLCKCNILFQKNISDVKKVKSRKCKILNDLKVWNHCEAKKKRYTS